MLQQWKRRIIAALVVSAPLGACVSGGKTQAEPADAGGADVPTRVQESPSDGGVDPAGDAFVRAPDDDAAVDAGSLPCRGTDCADAARNDDADTRTMEPDTGSVSMTDAGAPVDAGTVEDAGVTASDAGVSVGPCGAPRLIAPLSTTSVASSRPLLRWSLGGDPTDTTGATGATVELCADRACARVLESITPTESTARPANALPAGTVFWRVVGTKNGQRCANPSFVWQFGVPRTDRVGDVAAGTAPDFNGDGFSDIAVGAEGTVALYAGSRTGVSSVASSTLQPPARAVGEPPAVLRYGLHIASVGDTNGDGFPDLAVGGAQGAVFVYAGGPGGLAPQAMASLHGDSADPEFGKVSPAGDVNGDGYADMLVISSNVESGGPSHAYLFTGGPRGPVTAPAAVITAPDGTWFAPAIAGDAAADFDGDGFDDVALSAGGGTGRARVLLYLGSSAGLAAPARVVLEADLRNSVQIASLGDADGDGRPDLVAGIRGTNGGAIVLLRGGPSGLGDEPPIATGLNAGFSLRGARDVNGDGTPDLLVGGAPTASSVALYLLRPGGTAGTMPDAILPDPATDLQTTPEALGVGDVDGDGFPDVVLRDEARGVVEVYHSNAHGAAGPATPLTVPVGVSAYGRSVAPATN